MRLRGIDFGTVLDASGVRGFFGEGYAHHAWLRPFGLDLRGSTFVAKTATIAPRAGNMPLDARWRPVELRPRCVVVRFFSGAVLNAVGLSNPGAAALFEAGRWQRRREPFFISFMSVATDAGARLEELEGFVELAGRHLSGFAAPVGLQMNYSCPNVGVHADGLVAETLASLDVAGRLGIPLMPKFNLLMPPAALAVVAAHPACDALCLSNTLPWGALPDRIDWRALFGGDRSPLEEFGGGGLSGRPLLPLVAEAVAAARRAGVRVPINAGGGILGPSDVDVLKTAGADSVFLGSIAILRPWRVRRTVARARRSFSPDR